MLLQDRTALVFAATGAIGSAVARRFAAEGARVCLSGRDEAALRRLGGELDAPWQIVDATDEGQVAAYVDRIADERGRVDVVLNPSPETFNALKPLLAEAYTIVATRHANRQAIIPCGARRKQRR